MSEESIKRAVVYLRVGSSHQENRGAIERQRQGCLQIAEQHGLTIVREYVDVGRPAQLEQQPELRRLLDDLFEQRDASFVVVRDYARLGRSMGQCRLVKRLCWSSVLGGGVLGA